MPEEHIAEELLRRFLRGEVAKEDSRRIVRHLMERCNSCAKRAYRLAAQLGLWSEGDGCTTAGEERYEEGLRRVLALVTQEGQRTALEKLRGSGLWASLAALDQEVRLAIVESDPRCHNFGFYDRLVEASRFSMRSRPAEAMEIAHLAILVAERLDPEESSSQRIGDLKAAAWANFANVKRLASDFPGSRQAFNEAWQVLEVEGSNAPAERANLLCLESGYIRDMGEFETAESALAEALGLYQQLADTARQGRTLVKMANAVGAVDPERALAHLRMAGSLLTAGDDPRLDLCLQHDLAWYLTESGRAEEALVVLERARPLYQKFPDDWTQLRLHWLEGKIARSLEELAEAENIYHQLWQELRVRNLSHELVLLSIDLAETLVAKGSVSRAAELVDQCYPILKTWGLHRYALAAWIVFQRALAQHKTEDIFVRLRRYYRRHWVRPGVFEL